MEKNDLKLVYREDPIGYPNNQSIVAFSLNEKPSKKDFIVYYEYNKEKDELLRNEALISFAHSTTKISNQSKLNDLKNKILDIYPNAKTCSNLIIKNFNFENEIEKEFNF